MARQKSSDRSINTQEGEVRDEAFIARERVLEINQEWHNTAPSSDLCAWRKADSSDIPYYAKMLTNEAKERINAQMLAGS